MIERRLTARLLETLGESPAVALLGPRQSGKTTLALEVGEKRDALYLDLESEADRAKLAQPELYLAAHSGRLVILDEVHRAPGLFPVLRGLIDRARRAGHKAGQFLLLGSASLDLLKQSGETLAGRIAYLELGPLNALETLCSCITLRTLWSSRSLETLVSFNALRTSRTLITLKTLRTSRTLITLRSSRTLITLMSLSSNRTLVALRSSSSSISLRTSWTNITLVTLRTLMSLITLRSSITLVTLWTSWSYRTLVTLCTS